MGEQGRFGMARGEAFEEMARGERVGGDKEAGLGGVLGREVGEGLEESGRKGRLAERLRSASHAVAPDAGEEGVGRVGFDGHFIVNH
jgi:hypothetical protein